jgi:hypothetical protein
MRRQGWYFQAPFSILTITRGALVQAQVVGRRHVEDAVRAGQILHLLERVAQRGAELRRAGLGLLQRRGHRPVSSRPASQAWPPKVDTEPLPCAPRRPPRRPGPTCAPGCWRQLLGHQHRAGGQEGAVHVLAADAQEVVVGHAVGLVDLALVAALLERLLRQRRRRAGAGDQHRVGLGGHDLQHLAGDRGVGARIALVGDDLQALERGHLGELPYQPSP